MTISRTGQSLVAIIKHVAVIANDPQISTVPFSHIKKNFGWICHCSPKTKLVRVLCRQELPFDQVLIKMRCERELVIFLNRNAHASLFFSLSMLARILAGARGVISEYIMENMNLIWLSNNMERAWVPSATGPPCQNQILIVSLLCKGGEKKYLHFQTSPLKVCALSHLYSTIYYRLNRLLTSNIS